MLEIRWDSSSLPNDVFDEGEVRGKLKRGKSSKVCHLKIFSIIPDECRLGLANYKHNLLNSPLKKEEAYH